MNCTCRREFELESFGRKNFETILSYEFSFGLRLQQFLPTFRHLVFSFWFFCLRDIDPIFPLLQHSFQVVLDPMLDDPNSVVKLKFIRCTVSSKFWSGELCKREFVTWSFWIRNRLWSNSVFWTGWRIFIEKGLKTDLKNLISQKYLSRDERSFYAFTD